MSTTGELAAEQGLSFFGQFLLNLLELEQGEVSRQG